jgi:hypothetical protein
MNQLNLFNENEPVKYNGIKMSQLNLLHQNEPVKFVESE